MGAPLTLGRTSGGHGLTTPKTNFFHQRGRKAIHRRRGHAAMCPSFAMRPRERRRSGHREGREEKGGTNYSSHELRLRERDPRRPAAMEEEEDILSFYGEGERKTREE